MQGSTRLLTDAVGGVTSEYDYSAFGELQNSPSVETKYLYTGQQFDQSTGLYSLRARYYNPNAGRFVSRDPYPVNINDPFELNRYVYVANNAVNGYDPTGWNTATVAAPAGSQGGGNDYSGLVSAIISFLQSPAVVTAISIANACMSLYILSVILSVSRQGLMLALLDQMTPPPLKICLLPILYVHAHRMPNIALNIFMAQSVDGRPMLLTYFGIDPLRKKANRDLACPSSRPRPPGMQCDEYPFATTVEGGLNTSTMDVPAIEQQRQGGELNAFYGRLRMRPQIMQLPNHWQFAVVVVL
jgi:RHS repeat-associated protein